MEIARAAVSCMAGDGVTTMEEASEFRFESLIALRRPGNRELPAPAISHHCHHRPGNPPCATMVLSAWPLGPQGFQRNRREILAAAFRLLLDIGEHHTHTLFSLELNRWTELEWFRE